MRRTGAIYVYCQCRPNKNFSSFSWKGNYKLLEVIRHPLTLLSVASTSELCCLTVDHRGFFHNKLAHFLLCCMTMLYIVIENAENKSLSILKRKKHCRIKIPVLLAIGYLNQCRRKNTLTYLISISQSICQADLITP